ncbi:MAG: hypothetical protein AB8H80_00200 [Planctomycetota bacterium]
MNDLDRTQSLEAPSVPGANGPAPAAPAGAPPASESPRFSELLERLQRLAAEQSKPDEVQGPEGLKQALRTADDGYVAAMDLRQKLEEAFRRHMQ